MQSAELWQLLAKYDPDQPRDDHGRWGSGGSDARASASLSDRGFVSQHADRLSAAGDRARAAFPREQRGGNAAHDAAHHAIVAEAGRIHAENDAVAGPDESRLRGTLEDARAVGASHEVALERVAEERANIAEERAAAAAGHIGATPHAALDEYTATRERVDTEVARDTADLASAHDHAERALTELQARRVEADAENGIAGHDLGNVGDLAEHLRATDEVVGAADRQRHESAYTGHPGDHPGSVDDFADPAEHQRAVDAHRAASAANDAAFREHAAHAQTALEHLHEQQIRTQERLRSASHDLNAAHDRALAEVNSDHASLAHHTYREDEPPDPPDPLEPHADAQERAAHAAETAQYHQDLAQYQERQRAESASTRILDAEHGRRENLADHHPRALSADARSALKDEMRATAAAIRHLSHLTGRAPRLGGKTHKAANRPDGVPGASLLDMAAPYYRLRIKSLKFISAVDAGAQGPVANVALIKRAPSGDDVSATCRVFKLDEKLGLVFGWALATTLDGGKTPHVDLQSDAILGGDELIKVAAEFMEASAASDVMHDENPDGKIVFAMPLTKDVKAALGITSDVEGLAIAMKPSPETFKRFVAKELNAFSIGGTGEREVVKAMWSTADIDSLPDTSFLYIESGGTKEGGKTTPLSLRHFPFKDANGKVDLPHLRNAIARIPQSSLPKDVRDKLQVKAERMLAAEHDKTAKRVSKQAVLTSAVDGHQHSIDLDDPADEWRDALMTSYQTSAGADNGHCHAWTYDAAGKITIASDSGHTHTVDAVVPADVLAQAALNESGERCRNCGEMCEDDCCYCPKCGCRMDGDRTPVPITEAAGGSPPPVVVIAAHAPAGISTPSDTTTTVKSEPKESTAMANPEDRIRTLEAENAQLKKMSTLTDAQRTHINKLNEQDQLNFLNLTASQRDTVLAEIAKADEVVYESPYTKRVYRKSSPLEIVEAAREADAAKSALEQLKLDKRDHEFAKRGEQTLTHFAKGAKGDLRTRLMKALDAEFKEPAEYEEATKALKAANFALESLTKATGVNPHADPESASPATQLEQLVKRYETEHKVSNVKAYDAVLSTPEGARLYAQMPVGRA